MMHLRKESLDLQQGGGGIRGRDTRAESLEFFMESILTNSSTSNIASTASSLSNHLLHHHASFPGIRKESVDIDMLALTDEDAAASAMYFMQSSPMSPPMSHQLKSSIPIVAIGGSFSIPTSAASPLHVGMSSSNVLSDSTLISLGIDSKTSPFGMKNESKVMASPSTRRLRRSGADNHDGDDGDDHDGGSGMILNRIRGTTDGSFSLINADALIGARSRAFSMSSFGARSRAQSVEEVVSETLIFLSSDHEDDANPFDIGYRHRSMSSDSFRDSLGEAIGDHHVAIVVAAEIEEDEEEEEDAILTGSTRSPNIIKIARPPITSQTNKTKTPQNQSKAKPPLPVASRTRPTKVMETVKPKKANENTLPNSPDVLTETRKRSSSMNSSNSDLLTSQDRRLRKRPKSKTIAHLRSDDEDDSSDDYYDDDEYGNNDNKSSTMKGGKSNRTSTPGGSNANNSNSNQSNNRNLSSSIGNSKSSKSNSAATATVTPARNPMSPTMISSKTPSSNALNSKQKRLSIVKAETPGSVGSAPNDQLQKLQKPKKKDDQVRIGIYTLEERKKKIERFLQQRNYRVWQKKIKYNVRKDFADSRLRVKGRFVRKEDEDQLKDIIKMLF